MRVVASDDNQGRIGAQYMKDVLGVTKVYILDDKELYGKGVADAFEGSAKDIGLKVVGHEGWDKDAQNYTALMTKIKASGADGIYIGGVSTNNGGQLVKDKVQTVGNNDTVKMLVSDGFVLSSLFDEAGRGQRQRRVRHGADDAAGQADGRGQDVRRRLPAVRGRQAARGLHRLRRHGGAGAPRRDQPLRRKPLGRPLEAVRDEPARHGRRLDVVQRAGRSAERCRDRLHRTGRQVGLQGDQGAHIDG